METYVCFRIIIVLCGSRSDKLPVKQQRTLCERERFDFTNDYWKIIVNFDLMPYEEVVTTLREDLRELKEASKRSLPIGELRYVEAALRAAETKLADLKEYLPKADKRRGFIDIGGTFLKTLFGIATVAEINDLHATVNDLHKKQNTIVHAINEQVT
jgi:hypothetical protein